MTPWNTNTDVQEFFVPRLFPRQVSSKLHVSGLLSRSATGIYRFCRCSQQTFLSVHGSSRLATPASWFRNTLLQIHHLLVVLLDTCMFVCCSSDTRDVETVGCPGTGSHHPTHRAVICPDVNFRNFSSAVLVVLEVVLVLQGWCVLLAKNCFSILLRSLSALLCCIGSPAHVKLTASTALGHTSARGP